MAFQGMEIVTLQEAQERLGLSNIRWYKMIADRGKYKQPFPTEVAKFGRVKVYCMDDIVHWYNNNIRSKKRYDNNNIKLYTWED